MYKIKIGFQCIACLFLLESSLQCKNATKINSEESHETKVETLKFTAKDINEIKYTEYILSDLSEKKTKDWSNFQKLLSQIDVLENGDLSFFKDDKIILKGFIDDLKNETQKILNVPSIIVRLSVLETTMYKLEEASNLKKITKTALLDNIKELLIAFNNLILQMNKNFEKASQDIENPYNSKDGLIKNLPNI